MNGVDLFEESTGLEEIDEDDMLDEAEELEEDGMLGEDETLDEALDEDEKA